MWRALFIVLLSLASWTTAGAAAVRVGVIRIDGPIGPATAGYVARALDRAAAENLECLIIQLDTPGGLLESTKAIVQTFYRAKVPVVVYVSPEGATAASAGCFITLAADVAAMAPATSMGAAHPVELGGGGASGEDKKADETTKQKMENYAASYIESIAQKRGRNVEWARSAVKESASVTADKALELHAIDLVAKDLPDLLARLDGFKAGGRQLHTRDAEIVNIRMSLRESAFQLLWRPEVLFILMILAIYGLISELSNPGTIFPGVVGAIALILALYLGAILPINLAGVALIVFAVALFIADIFAPTHGVLTVGGSISFLLGSLMLFDTSEPAFRLSLSLVIPATVLTTLFFVVIVAAGLKAQRLPVRAGSETLLGKAARAVGRFDRGEGKVFVEGEYWNAVSDQPVDEGQWVEVTARDGLVLQVKPKTKD